MAASVCYCLAIISPEICAAFGNEMLPLFGEYQKTRWRFVNFSHLTHRVTQTFLESFDLVVVGNFAELVKSLTLIHHYIELFWLFVEIKTIYFPDVRYWSI